MSTYTDASLIVTPNGKKAGKLYALKGADLDVVRATTATYVGSDGLIKTALANEPRFDYSNGSCPSILVEEQRTNLCLQSSKFDLSPWNNNTVITANTDIAPDGTSTAYTLDDTSTIVYRTLTQSISVSANSTTSASVFIKKTTGTLTNYPGITILFTGGNARVARVILNTTTGSFNLEGVTTINTFARVVNFNDYWRIEFTTTDNGNNTSASFVFSPAISSDGTTITPTATGSAVFWGSQFELGSNTTSYIPTTTTSVTRNADVISKTGLTGITTITETFEDDTTNVISGSPTTYTMSQGRIKHVIGI